MSRSGYNEDYDNGWSVICWRGAVKSAIRGKRGQAFIEEMLNTLDSMPEKRLITNDLEDREGNVCALGAVGKARGLDMSELDPEEPDQVARAFGIAPALVREIVYENDLPLWGSENSPEGRWQRMRKWIESLKTGMDKPLAEE